MPTVAELLTRALQHHQAGDLARAANLYVQVLEKEPQYAEALHLLGMVAHQVGRQDKALDLLHKAIALDGNNPVYLSNLGVVQRAVGDLAGAAESYRRALQLQPDSVEAHTNLGTVLAEQGKRDEAADHFCAALTLKPDNVWAHNNLGNLLKEAGRLDEAEACYREALRLQPGFALALNNLGNVLKERNRFEEALDCFREALRLQPGFAEAHNNMGTILRQQGLLTEAEACHQEALRLKPDSVEAMNNLGVVLLEQWRVDEAAAQFRRILDIQPDRAGTRTNLLSCLTHDPRLDPATVFAEHRRWGEIQERAAKPLTLHVNASDPERRLRIGYVSAHCCANFFEPILLHHDPARFEVVCYTDVQDGTGARLRALAPRVCSTLGLNDAQMAERVRDDGIDILVDLAGHSATNRLGVFAYKPALVQVTYLGYPNTTGLTRMDYKLTDAILEPPEDAEAGKWYTEELVRLPSGVSCYAPPENAPEVTPLPARRTGRITFGSLHRLTKLHAGVFDLWAAVLRAVPTSKLLMFRHPLRGATQERVRQAFHERGIGDDRLDLRHTAGPGGYWEVYGEIDLCLDVFPWTSHTTSCESFWMGVPVLTLAGNRAAGRLSASVLTYLGLPEWIARTPEEYVAQAVKLAGDWDSLAEMRAGMRERMRTRLGDGERFTRELEEVYREMWRRFVSVQCAVSSNE